MEAVVSRKQHINKFLMQACSKGLVKNVALFLNQGADINFEIEQKLTPLHCASIEGHYDVVKYLLDHGANINAETDNNHTPLLLVSADYFKNTHNFKIIKLLFEYGASIHSDNEITPTPLHVVCNEGDSTNFTLIKFFLEKGIDINIKSPQGKTPLHFACEEGDKKLKMIDFLIENGANVNAESDTKVTPLLVALYAKQLNTAKLLIQNKADIYFKINIIPTALFVAVITNQVEMTEYLLKSFPELIDIKMVDYDCTALDIACGKKQEAIIKVFSKHGIHTISEKQAEKNMRAFFAELDQEAYQAQVKREQNKQKKLHNKKNKELNKQNIISTNKQKNNKANHTINTTPLNTSTNNAAIDDKCRQSDNPTSPNTSATSFTETAIILTTNPPDNPITVCLPLTCVTNSISSKKTHDISQKKQQPCIQSQGKFKPIQVNNEYLIGHDLKLKWPRSLNGAQYDSMRNHLRQLKYWPETLTLDIKSLKGQSGMWRLRVGSYRVLFLVNDAQHRIIIHEIGLRKKIYKAF